MTESTSSMPDHGGRFALRKKIQTPLDAYNDYVAENGYFMKPPEGATDAVVKKFRDADLKRWFALRVAISSQGDPDYIKSIEQADTPEKLRMARTTDPGVLGINDLVDREGAEALEKLTGTADSALIETARKRMKMAQQLSTMDFVKEEGPMTKERVLELAKEHRANVFLVTSEEEINERDETYQRLKDNAEQARAFAQLGMQRKEYKEGIDEDTPEEVKQQFLDHALASASAMQKFEAYQDLQTRPDGQCTRKMRCDVEKFSARMQRESNGIALRLDNVQFLDAVVTGTKLEEKKEQLYATLLMIEQLEGPVYTPRLFTLLKRRNAYRAMPFSEIFSYYSVVLNILVQSDVAPSAKEAHAIRAEEVRKHKAAGIKKLKRPEELTNRDLYSREECRKIFFELREHARKVFLNKVESALLWFNELDQDEANKSLWESKGQSAPPVDKEASSRWTKAFYFQIYQVMTDYRVDLLNAYEGAILLFLHKYILKKERAYLSTRLESVDPGLVHEQMVEKMQEENDRFESGRKFVQNITCFETAKRFPELPESEMYKSVHPDQPWSPTFGQIKKFVEFFDSLRSVKQKELAEALKVLSETLKKKDEETEAAHSASARGTSSTKMAKAMQTE